MQRLSRFLVRLTLGVAALALQTPHDAYAQFRTPTPQQLPVADVQADIIRKKAWAVAKEGASAVELCRRLAILRISVADTTCVAALAAQQVRVTSAAAQDSIDSPSLSRTVVPARWLPFTLPRDSMLTYLATASVDRELGFLGDLFATASARSAYVATDVIGGLLGRSLFSLSYARVVVRDTVADTNTTSLVANDEAAMQRLINNGGTVASRFVVPLWASGGTTAQRAISLYPVLGMDGPLDKPDSLSLVASLIGEGVMSLAIRSPNGSATQIGTLELGVRAGLLRADRALLSVARSPKGASFVQLGVGLRQGEGQMGVTVLYTAMTSRQLLRAYYPRFIVSFSALKM